jgi:NTP pyrophosphatase (non-canonical NTP hydrolase)
MTKTLDLTKKALEIYNANKKKGLHPLEEDIKLSISKYIALIHSEISEMLEAHRENRYSKCNFLDTTSGNFNIKFEENIKDSVEDEYADILIRTLDLAGNLKLKISLNLNVQIEYLDFFDFINYMHTLCSNISENTLAPEIAIKALIRALVQSQDFLKIPLYSHMDMKLKYNTLRPYKHGKNY